MDPNNQNPQQQQTPPTPQPPLHSPSPQPNFQQPAPAPNHQTSALTIVGFILAFLLPLIGLIMSIIALDHIKKRNEGGRSLAIAGIIVAILSMIVSAAIFVTLTLSTFGGIQNKAKDTERETDIKAIHGQLESYYATNAMYPTLANLNDLNWRSANLKALDSEALRDPQGTESNLSSEAAAGVYAYVPVNKSGATCDNIKVMCDAYTLETTLENGGRFYKSNLN